MKLACLGCFGGSCAGPAGQAGGQRGSGPAGHSSTSPEDTSQNDVAKWRRLLRLLVNVTGTSFEQLQRIVSLIALHGSLDVVSVVALSSTGLSAVCLAASGECETGCQPGMPNITGGSSNYSMQKLSNMQGPLYSADLTSHDWPTDWLHLATCYGIQALIAVPIWAPSGMVGMLTVGNRQATSLHNRRHWDQQLETLSAWFSRLFQDGQLAYYATLLEEMDEATSITSMLKVITQQTVAQHRSMLYSGKVHCRVAMCSVQGGSALLFDELRSLQDTFNEYDTSIWGSPSNRKKGPTTMNSSFSGHAGACMIHSSRSPLELSSSPGTRKRNNLMGAVPAPVADGYASTVDLEWMVLDTNSRFSPLLSRTSASPVEPAHNNRRISFQLAPRACSVSVPSADAGHMHAPGGIVRQRTWSDSSGKLPPHPSVSLASRSRATSRANSKSIREQNELDTENTSVNADPVEGNVIKLEGTVLGEAITRKQGIWVQDCAAFMQDKSNPNTDVFFATSQDASGCLVVTVMYHEKTPLLGVYITLSHRYSPVVLQKLVRSVNEGLSVIQPLLWSKLTGDLLDEWDYLQCQALNVPLSIRPDGKQARTARTSIDMAAITQFQQSTNPAVNKMFNTAPELSEAIKGVHATQAKQEQTAPPAETDWTTAQKSKASEKSPAEKARAVISKRPSLISNLLSKLAEPTSQSARKPQLVHELDGLYHKDHSAESSFDNPPAWPSPVSAPCLISESMRMQLRQFGSPTQSIEGVPDTLPLRSDLSADSFASTNGTPGAPLNTSGDSFTITRTPSGTACKQTKKMRAPSFKVAQSQGSSSGKRMSALITGLQDRVQEAQRQQLNQQALDPSAEDLKGIHVVARIGTGGFSSCYLAMYHGAQVALKVIHERNGSEVEVFRNAVELAVMSTLSHPNIVQVLTFFTDAGVSYPSPEALMEGGCAPVILHSPAEVAHAAVAGVETADTLYDQLLATSSNLAAGLPPASPVGQEEMLATMGLSPSDLVPKSAQPGAFPRQHISKALVICMEYCNAGTLWDAIQEGAFLLQGQPNWVAIYQTLLEVASALRYLHTLRLVHRDLKPQNVLLKENSTDPRGFSCKLSDFGLAKLRSSNASVSQNPSLMATYDSIANQQMRSSRPSSLETPSGTLRRKYSGTVTHLPPEVFATGEHEVDASADVYAFGIMMWEVASAKMAYGVLQTDAIIHQVVDCNVRPTFGANVPPEYTGLASRCWHADPRQRPTAEVVVHTLNRLLADERFMVLKERVRKRASRLSLLSSPSTPMPVPADSPVSPSSAISSQAVPFKPSSMQLSQMEHYPMPPSAQHIRNKSKSARQSMELDSPQGIFSPDTSSSFPVHIL